MSGRVVHRVAMPSGRVVELDIQQLPARTVIRFRGVQPALDDGDQVAFMDEVYPLVRDATRDGVPVVIHNPHSGEVATVHDKDDAGWICVEIDQAQA